MPSQFSRGLTRVCRVETEMNFVGQFSSKQEEMNTVKGRLVGRVERSVHNFLTSVHSELNVYY
jgi:hypothetical protein